MSDAASLALRIDAAAAEVAGVARVYSAAPAVIGLVKAVLPANSPLSIVREGRPVQVVVSVGVDARGRAPEIADAVADAVRTIVGADAEVHVRVSRVVASA